MRVLGQQTSRVDDDEGSDRLFALTDGLRWVLEDFGETSVLFNPVSQGPDQEGQNPMTLDLFLVADLILVEAEVVFEFAEGFLDTPAQEVSKDGVFDGHGEIVGDEDVNIFVVRIRPFVKDEEDLQGGWAVFKFGLEAVGEDMFNLTVLLGDFDMFKAMGIMFFDERNNLISAQI